MENLFCIVSSVLLLIVFSAVNLFLPYALLVLGLFVGLGFACRLIQRKTRGAQCPLGFC